MKVCVSFHTHATTFEKFEYCARIVKERDMLGISEKIHIHVYIPIT